MFSLDSYITNTNSDTHVQIWKKAQPRRSTGHRPRVTDIFENWGRFYQLDWYYCYILIKPTYYCQNLYIIIKYVIKWLEFLDLAVIWTFIAANYCRNSWWSSSHGSRTMFSIDMSVWHYFKLTPIAILCVHWYAVWFFLKLK